jgi:hypothetical protein
LRRAVPCFTAARPVKCYAIVPYGDLTRVDKAGLRCFASLCDAMHVRDVPLSAFSSKELVCAFVLSRHVGANGIMVLSKHLLLQVAQRRRIHELKMCKENMLLK